MKKNDNYEVTTLASGKTSHNSFQKNKAGGSRTTSTFEYMSSRLDLVPPLVKSSFQILSYFQK